jgi:hypothetical protein
MNATLKVDLMKILYMNPQRFIYGSTDIKSRIDAGIVFDMILLINTPSNGQWIKCHNVIKICHCNFDRTEPLFYFVEVHKLKGFDNVIGVVSEFSVPLLDYTV